MEKIIRKFLYKLYTFLQKKFGFESTTSIFVVAGTFQEFIFYTQNNHKCIYIDTSFRLYGVNKPLVILVGTYYKRHDWADIQQILIHHNAEIIKFNG